MSIQTKTKRLHYRRADFLAGKSFNLQNLLTAALNNLSQVSLRQQPTSPGSTEFRLINDVVSQQSMLFGDFFTYESGANKLQVAVDPKAKALDVAQVAPRQTHPGKRSEFLDNVLFFAVFNNHVVLMQSHAWQANLLEGYLNWLLDQAGLLKVGNRVELSDVPSAKIRAKAASNDIKAISFRAPVVEVQEEESSEGHASTKRSRTASTASSIVAERKLGAELIRSLLGDNEFDKLRLDGAAGGNLRVNMKITFERETTEVGQRTLNRIAKALSNVDLDDDAVRLDIPGVGTVKGTELKLTRRIDVQTSNGVVPPDQVFPQMATWIRDLLQNNLID